MNLINGFDKTLMEDAVRLAGKHKHYLHTIPEPAFNELRTTEYIKKVCAEYPVELIDIGMETGAVYYLDAGCKETVALRTDIDAVPTEQGPLHLCGHDAHIATMLGALHYLCGITGKAETAVTDSEDVISQQKEKRGIPYNVLFIFQPAEEGTHGAKAMLDHGLLEKVPQRPVRIFGIHNRPEVPVGDVVVHKGPLMSEKSVFKITLTGVPGHGSLPHKCVDPIVAAGSLICSVQTIVSRNVDPFKPAICTFNSVKAGMSESSAPETAVLTGYIRSLDHETHVRMEERLTCLAESMAVAYECKCDTAITHMVPAVDNPKEMYEIAVSAAETALIMASGVRAAHDDQPGVRKGQIVDSDPCLASEDFAVYGTEISAFFYWVGSGTPGKKNAPWHDLAFSIDARYFETAVPVLCASALTKG